MKKGDYYFWTGFALSFFTPIVASYMIELYLSINLYTNAITFSLSLAIYVY